MNYDNFKPCKKCKINPALQQSAYCIECKKERTAYDKDYFKQHVVEKSASASQIKRDLLAWYRAQKDNKTCLVCLGTFRFFALDFDHIPGRGKKIMEVSKLVRLGYSKEKIQIEIAKCELICKNCHAGRTYERSHNKKEF